MADLRQPYASAYAFVIGAGASWLVLPIFDHEAGVEQALDSELGCLLVVAVGDRLEKLRLGKQVGQDW